MFSSLLSDVRVALTEAFDRNFERKAFFTDAWKARRYYNPRGSLLMVTGTLRRSIKSVVRGASVRFSSAVPYAALHNEGLKGNVSVRSHTRRSRGGRAYTVRAHLRMVQMPERRFIGDSPEVRRIIKRVFDENLRQIQEQMNINLKQHR